MNLAETVATNFRARRKALFITQAEVARSAGVTVETVARLERVLRGRQSANANPSLETLERLANALGFDVIDLLTSKKTKVRKDELDLGARRHKPAAPQTHRRSGQGAEAGREGPVIIDIEKVKTIQKVEIVVTSNQNPSRIARALRKQLSARDDGREVCLCRGEHGPRSCPEHGIRCKKARRMP